MWILHLFHSLVLLFAHIIVMIAQKHRPEHTVPIAISQLLLCKPRLHGRSIDLLIRASRSEKITNLVLSHCVLLCLGHFCDDRGFLVQ